MPLVIDVLALKEDENTIFAMAFETKNRNAKNYHLLMNATFLDATPFSFLLMQRKYTENATQIY